MNLYIHVHVIDNSVTLIHKLINLDVDINFDVLLIKHVLIYRLCIIIGG